MYDNEWFVPFPKLGKNLLWIVEFVVRFSGATKAYESCSRNDQRFALTFVRMYC